MSSKKNNVKHSSKPIFKSKKKSENSVLGIIFMLAMLAALVFIGYSVGKPVVEFLKGERNSPVAKGKPDDTPSFVEPDDKADTEPTKLPEPVITTPEATASSDPEPAAVPETDNDGRLKFIDYYEETSSYESYILSAIEQAASDGYSGVCVELILNGGRIAYKTQSQTAINADAIALNAIDDLSLLKEKSVDLGLKLYARVSALTDNIASWYDKSISFMIEGSESRWLDNSVAKGGKPWISPYAKGSAEYIGEMVREISNAGFDGLIVGELEFPPLRKSDEELIGTPVKSADRHKALSSFAEALYNSFGTAKEFYIEVDAENVVAGNAEILKDAGALCTKIVYVRFDPQTMAKRVKRVDGTEVSFEGLNSVYFEKTVFKLVDEALSGTDIEVVPIVIE